MKQLIFLAASSLMLVLGPMDVLAQKRPPAKAPTAAAKPTPIPKAKTPAEALFKEGLKCAAEDYDCQVSNYTKAINLGLSTKDVYKNRGNAYLQRKDFDKAVADFSKVIELDPNDTNGYKNRGKLYLEISNSPQATNAAIRDFTSAIDLEPKDVEAYGLRSSAYMKLRNFERAKADMAKIAAIEPNNVAVKISQGEMFLAESEYDKGIESFDKAIAIKPVFVAYLRRGNAFASQRKYDLAIADLNRAMEFEPRNAEVYFSRGQISEKTKRISDAIIDYRKAIELNSKHAASYEKLSRIYLSQKTYDRAIEDANKAIQIAPERHLPYLVRGSADYALNNYQSDVQYKKDYESYKSLFLKNASQELEASPNNVQLIYNRGYAYVANGQPQLALNDFSRAIEINSNFVDAYVMRGSIYQTSNVALAIKDFSQLIDLEPLNFDNYTNRATAYLMAGQYDSGLKDRTKVIELSPNNAEAYNLRALYISSTLSHGLAMKIQNAIQFGESNSVLGLNDFSRAIEMEPKNDYFYLTRGQFFRWIMGTNKTVLNAAIVDFQKCIGLNGENARTCSKELQSTSRSYDSNVQVEKTTKQVKRNQAILEVMGAINSGLEAYNRARQTASREQTTQPNTPSSPQTPQNAGTSDVGGGSTSDGSSGRHKYLKDPVPDMSSVRFGEKIDEQSFTGCSTDTLYKNLPQMKHCFGPWQQSPLSQIQFRIQGPVGRGYNAINDEPDKRSYQWYAGLKNTSGAIVYMKYAFTTGDGEEKFWIATLGPGQYLKLNDSAFVTFSNAPTMSFRFLEYEICSDVSRISYAGGQAWQCNEK